MLLQILNHNSAEYEVQQNPGNIIFRSLRMRDCIVRTYCTRKNNRKDSGRGGRGEKQRIRVITLISQAMIRQTVTGRKDIVVQHFILL